MKDLSYYKKNLKLLMEAEEIALNLNIDLKYFYNKKFQIKEEYTQLNGIKKVIYEDLVKANSFGANNGFKGILKELDSIKYLVEELHSGDFEEFILDKSNKAIYEQTLELIEKYFEHICKWINIDKNN